MTGIEEAALIAAIAGTAAEAGAAGGATAAGVGAGTAAGAGLGAGAAAGGLGAAEGAALGAGALGAAEAGAGAGAGLGAGALGAGELAALGPAGASALAGPEAAGAGAGALGAGGGAEFAPAFGLGDTIGGGAAFEPAAFAPAAEIAPEASLIPASEFGESAVASPELYGQGGFGATPTSSWPSWLTLDNAAKTATVGSLAGTAGKALVTPSTPTRSGISPVVGGGDGGAKTTGQGALEALIQRIAARKQDERRQGRVF